jgi:shikimate kinase
LSHGAAPPPERIVLVGFMAAGKSSVGRSLAGRLGWDLLDFDDLVLHRTGLSAGELIRAQGEPALRRLEAELTGEVAGRRRVVLAPGGGWATRPELAERLGPGTVRVWLRLSAAEAVRRALAQGVDRPLLGAGEAALARAEALLEERSAAYGHAELAVDVEGKGVPAVVTEIVHRLDLEPRDDER